QPRRRGMGQPVDNSHGRLHYRMLGAGRRTAGRRTTGGRIMYPMLKPALRRGWRDRETVRFGVAPAHAKEVGPVDTATGCFLDMIDGTRSMRQLDAAARSLDLRPGRARGVVERLGAAGLLEAPAAGGPAAEAVRADGPALERLRPDL